MDRPTATNEPTNTSADQLFDQLVADIVSGRHRPGSRLPSERELSGELGCSRSTLREVLSRLIEWGLIETRRGSGMVVRDRREWSMYVLPAWLRHGAVQEGPQEVARLVVDMLEVRRSILCDLIGTIARRVPAGSLEAARACARRAEASRHDRAAFVRHDFDVLRTLAESAGFLPGLWILNSFSEVYFEIADMVSGPDVVGEDYLDNQERFFAALEARDVEGARATLDRYLQRHDERLLTNLGIAP